MDASDGNADDAAAPSQSPRRVCTQHSQSGAVSMDVGRSRASAASPEAMPESMAAVPSPPEHPLLPDMAATANSLRMSTAPSFSPQSRGTAVSDHCNSELDGGGKGSGVFGAAASQRKRRNTECDVNTRRQGGSSHQPHRAPRALAADRTPQQVIPSPETGRRSLSMTHNSGAISISRARPGTASYGAGLVAGPPGIPFASTATPTQGSSLTPAVTLNSLLSTLYTPSTSTTHVTSFIDSCVRHDAAVEHMSLLAPAADFHGMPVTPQGDQERRRRQSHTNHQQLTTPEAGAASEEGCVIPSQRRLSWMPSQSLQPERRTSRFLTSCPGADPAVFRLTDHAVDNVEYATMQLLVEQRTELPARDTEAGGSDGRASANVHPQHQEESRNGESAEVIDWPDGAHFTHLTSTIPLAMDTMSTGLALPQQARIATAEERRVRLLFHSRPHIRLTTRPQVVTNAVLDRPRWAQPLCYLPLCIPCMHNAFYSVPLSTVMRASWEPTFSSWQPSLAFSDSERPILPRREQPSGNLSGAVNVGSRAWATPVTAVMPTTAAFYHVPITAPLLAQSTMSDRRAGGELLLHPEPGTSLSNPLSHIHTHTVASLQEARLSTHNETTSFLARFSHKCRHFVYRCFCVRCAIASQAQALQADAEMRGIKAVPFPCCTCLGVESKSRSELLTTLCLLDLFTLGAPFGCCCYHGLGSALYGWHLRYMLRARYRIFAWTSIDLLIVCCIPGLALDQQGAELLLNGTPESTVGLQFMA